MRLLCSPLPLSAALMGLLSLACAGKDKDGNGGLLGTDGIAHPDCDAWVACSSAVSPETAADVVGSYGTSSVCWDDETSAEVCETACGDSLAQAHQDHPTVAECDDGSPLHSDSILGDPTWRLEVTGTEGGCDGVHTTYLELVFDPNGGTDFEVEIEFHDGSNILERWLNAPCHNDDRTITCSEEEGSDRVIHLEMSSGLGSMTGSFDDADNDCVLSLSS